jgi:glycosyltransferase involved in cell wall biosynthesis
VRRRSSPAGKAAGAGHTEDPTVSHRESAPLQVLVPITVFPVPGGMANVLACVERAMAGEWEFEYLTTHPNATDSPHLIHRFGSPGVNPWNVPPVWGYVRSGRAALRRLLQKARYDLLLPQDGVYTSYFTLQGAAASAVPVIPMDHGNVTLPRSQAFRDERLPGRGKSLSLPSLDAARFALYRRALLRMATEVARSADAFLAAGDDVAEAWVEQFRARADRVVQFPFAVDAGTYEPLSTSERLAARARAGIPADAIVLTMVNRLVPEKAPAFALRAIARATSLLADEQRRRLRVLIAGDGHLREQVETDMRLLGLASTCSLTGALSPDGVAHLLRVSDAFLYTATRGINSLAVLEAMAAACAVVATTRPLLIAKYLAEGRGVAVPPGDLEATAHGLARVLGNPTLAQAMGRHARAYVLQHHTDAELRRSLRNAIAIATTARRGGLAGRPT